MASLGIGAIAGPEGLASRRWRLPPSLLAFVAPLLVAACASLPQSAPATVAGDPPPLAPEPLRSLGLVLHTAGLAVGGYGHLDGQIADNHRLPETEALAALQRSGNRHSVTWIGHSTVLLRLGGRAVLTDPVFGDGPPPVSGLPRRLVPPALPIERLPPIDVVVISHGDLDHLHRPSLRALAQRFPEAHIVVPEGFRDLARRSGFAKATELPVGASVNVAGLRLTALPAVHATRRPGHPARAALSWEIAGAGRKVLFVGDTGYGPVFEEIGAQRGPYDLALVPIGAYEPRHLVADMHVDPEEAAQIARDVRAPLAVGIHWGTFALSPEPFMEPAERFTRAGGSGVTTRVLRIGETLILR